MSKKSNAGKRSNTKTQNTSKQKKRNSTATENTDKPRKEPSDKPEIIRRGGIIGTRSGGYTV